MSDESVRVDPRNEQKRYEVLSGIADLIVQTATLPDLIHQTARCLEQVAAFQYLCFSQYDPTKNCLRLHLWEGETTPPMPMELSIQESPSGMVWRTQEPLLIRDMLEDQRFPVLDNMRERISHLRRGPGDQRTKADWRAGHCQSHSRCVHPK